MSWLTWTKLRPVARSGQAPQQDDILPRDVVRLSPIRWQISLNGRPLGWAAHDIERFSDGRGRVDSTVRIERLSIDQVLEKGFGSLATLLSRGLGADMSDGMRPISLRIDNSTRFDRFGQMESFESTVVEDTWGECIRLSGEVRQSQLLIKAYLVLGVEQGKSVLKPVYQKVLELPPDKLVVDSLAPQPRFRNLRVGQRWTFESYHPFFPTRPLQTIAARVEDRRMLRIAGEDHWTFHIVYERGDDDGLSLDRHVGDVFVANDGTVVRETLSWGGMTLTFDLQSDADDNRDADNDRAKPWRRSPSSEEVPKKRHELPVTEGAAS